ncbi:hypothetical protein T439DRAFT_379217 [Meredithblackwellia eburnea MCA 4105]
MAGVPPPPPPFPQGFRPPPPGLPPLQPGWTEHRAPAGQPYWFNPSTNVSTYTRPTIPFHFPPPPHQLQQHPPPPPPAAVVKEKEREKKDKKEKPKLKVPIPGTDWIQVTTNKGNVFWTDKTRSVWTVPDEIKEQVEKMDREREEEAAKEKEREKGKNLKREREEEEEEHANGEEKKKQAQDDDEEEEEKGTLDIQVGEGESELKEQQEPPTESGDPEEDGGEEGGGEGEVEKKKKKKRKTVVREIEEMEADEAWQREIAGQMAEQAEREERERESLIAAQAQSQEVQQRRQKEEEENRKREEEGRRLAAINEVSREEASAMFKIMLSEKDIQPMAPWDMELPKFVNDPRYSAVKLGKDRRDLFDEFCKEKIRAQRAAKKAAAEAGAPKADPLEAYRALLSSVVTSTRTHFSDFKKAHGKDPRFREFGKTEGEKEKVFKGFLRELGEKKRKEMERLEGEFEVMLNEDRGLKIGDKWTEVKTRFAKDKRYIAIPSSSQKETLFNQFLSKLSSSSNTAPTTITTSTTPSTNTLSKAERAAASLREREEQVRVEKERNARSARNAKGLLGREEGEREFKSLLIDLVRDHEARWNEVLPALSKDSRFTDSPLSSHDQRRLFDLHLTSLYDRRLGQVEGLFHERTPSLDSKLGEEVLEGLLEEQAVVRLVGGKDGAAEKKVEGLWKTWMRKRETKARGEFEDLLRESPVVQHWGRLRKKAVEDEEKGEGNKAKGVEDEEAEDEDMIDIGEMAKQVDIKAVHAVLKHDKRYLVYDHKPEERNKWIEDYLSNLSAPTLTVHQRE